MKIKLLAAFLLFIVFLLAVGSLSQSGRLGREGAKNPFTQQAEKTMTTSEEQTDEGIVPEEVDQAPVVSDDAVVAPLPPVNPDIKTTKEGVKYLIDPKKIRSGGPPQDGIPSIDNPKFVSVAEADEFIADNELVLAVTHKGVIRVYPLQIMVWHEIVNDTIAGDPILITYCPLCGSGIAFERTIDGEAVEFGTSGKLYNSNLVMYDRLTGTYWTQIDGRAIVGELTGMELTATSMDTVVWRDWKQAHPESEVLSQDTGHNRNYGRDPYGSYYEESFLFFPVEAEDNRIHPKTVIFGIEVDGVYKAYKEDDLKKVGTIDDVVGGANLRVTRDDIGVVKIINTDDDSEIVKERDFWFAWYAFHPDTEVYQP